MKQLLIAIIATIGFALPAQAEQLKNIGELEVHYSTFPSTFLTADIAKNYRIQRSRYSALINVTVLDTSTEGKPAVAAQVKGTARNLVGNEKNLTFREVREGDAIYYIAELSHANEERFRFNIDVSRQSTSGNIQFEQTYFAE
ncbi:DUF4426 domain-containing protein [Photobacterium sp. WH77]|uniref:DUF4426 domain-containing protein n=1 Tax=Photobacterium arenosum TaxID=2774143 RepID=A0ABR9BKY8_9GAMM|nr:MULTISPECIES: DUF4426 domain-containing protein [Photobacterium]MBD8513011.1 DUF4426 domain-containing protein [Photobacterium arenosum]MBV7261945.1 DUF4426 domain-containing protein [Photobacterium sp. WH24]MCG2836662.1 DUF4426 domain-containing protein [Photobacterium sp. WH77]MCG2844211.1 DUF4426 domain-containing protein [Photobacterium sp. WH80]MDO6582042.1 DUF4426 domain-containing protein [Photobacterium sp. 2_MG-2023]